MRFRVLSSVDLPQPDGPINAVISFSCNLQIDILERLEIPVVEVKVLYVKFIHFVHLFSTFCLPHRR